MYVYSIPGLTHTHVHKLIQSLLYLDHYWCKCQLVIFFKPALPNCWVVRRSGITKRHVKNSVIWRWNQPAQLVQYIIHVLIKKLFSMKLTFVAAFVCFTGAASSSPELSSLLESAGGCIAATLPFLVPFFDLPGVDFCCLKIFTSSCIKTKDYNTKLEIQNTIVPKV